MLCAFDLLELDGEDLRRTPIEERKHILAKLLSDAHEGIAFNEHYTGEGAIIFKHVWRTPAVAREGRGKVGPEPLSQTTAPRPPRAALAVAVEPHKAPDRRKL